MNTRAPRRISIAHSQTDLHEDAFDDLVLRSSCGDARALDAIATNFGPLLLEEARRGLGTFAEEAPDVLQDFFVSLIEGASLFTPAHGRATSWMRGIVGEMARTQRFEREERWGIEADSC